MTQSQRDHVGNAYIHIFDRALMIFTGVVGGLFLTLQNSKGQQAKDKKGGGTGRRKLLNADGTLAVELPEFPRVRDMFEFMQSVEVGQEEGNAGRRRLQVIDRKPKKKSKKQKSTLARMTLLQVIMTSLQPMASCLHPGIVCCLAECRLYI